jgi:hypothetical protein
MKNSPMIERSKHLCQPLAAAVCQKLSQADAYYTWFLRAGEPRLLRQAKTIYQEFFHQRGGRVPCLAVLAEKTRIGLLLVALCPEHQEGENAEAPLSIYLEFGKEDISSVFQAAAALLYAYDDNLYPEHLRHFRAYSRQYPEEGQAASGSQTPPIELPACQQQIDEDDSFLSSEVALPSIRQNRRKCAGYLRKLSESGELSVPLILISAGRVTHDVLQQFADDYSFGKLIVLTLSATVQDELDLRSAAERYIPETIRERIMLGVKKLLAGIKHG